jgi:hypothetical protein
MAELSPEMEKELNEIGKQVSNSWFRPYDEALGMPPGSIRAILAIIVVATTAYFIYASISIPEWWAVVVGIILRDYFAGGDKRDTTKLLNGGNK